MDNQQADAWTVGDKVITLWLRRELVQICCFTISWGLGCGRFLSSLHSSSSSSLSSDSSTGCSLLGLQIHFHPVQQRQTTVNILENPAIRPIREGVHQQGANSLHSSCKSGQKIIHDPNGIHICRSFPFNVYWVYVNAIRERYMTNTLCSMQIKLVNFIGNLYSHGVMYTVGKKYV